MEGTIVSHTVTAAIQNTRQDNSKVISSPKVKSDSMEFLSGMLFLIKKVFLLG